MLLFVPLLSLLHLLCQIRYAQQRGETAFALVDTLALLAAMGGFVAVRWSPEPDITVVTELIPERQAPSFQ